MFHFINFPISLNLKYFQSLNHEIKTSEVVKLPPAGDWFNNVSNQEGRGQARFGHKLQVEKFQWKKSERLFYCQVILRGKKIRFWKINIDY